MHYTSRFSSHANACIISKTLAIPVLRRCARALRIPILFACGCTHDSKKPSCFECMARRESFPKPILRRGECPFNRGIATAHTVRTNEPLTHGRRFLYLTKRAHVRHGNTYTCRINRTHHLGKRPGLRLCLKCDQVRGSPPPGPTTSTPLDWTVLAKWNYSI